MEKIKNNKITIILTLLISLVPLIVGIILWNKLPDTIATHFGSDGVANGFSSKTFAVYGLPLIMLVGQIFIIFIMATDPKKQGVSDSIFRIALWLFPVISIYSCCACYVVAIKGEEYSSKLFNFSFSLVMVGIICMIFGNALPKARRNYTFGIRTRWTLDSNKNWEATHRLGAYVMCASGFIVFLLGIISAFIDIPKFITGMAFVLSFVVFPLFIILYSYFYYVKHKEDPDYSIKEEE